MFEKLLFLLSFWRRQFNTSVKYYCTQNWKSLSELVRGKQYTEWHRIIDSTYLHVSTRNISHAKAQRARRFMGTQNAQNDTEFCFWQKNIFLSHADDADVRRKLCDTLRLCVRINNIVCESLCRLRETKTRRKDSVSSVSSVWKILSLEGVKDAELFSELWVMPCRTIPVYLGNLLVYSYLVNLSTKISCKFVPICGSKTYAQIREDTWRLFCVFLCVLCAKIRVDTSRYVETFLCVPWILCSVCQKNQAKMSLAFVWENIRVNTWNLGLTC